MVVAWKHTKKKLMPHYSIMTHTLRRTRNTFLLSSVASFGANTRKLEFHRTTNTVPLNDEKQILKQIGELEKKKRLVLEWEDHQKQVQQTKVRERNDRKRKGRPCQTRVLCAHGKRLAVVVLLVFQCH